jgi:hypothetical protein
MVLRMGPAVLFVSLVIVLGLFMILGSGPLASGARKFNLFLPDADGAEYERRRKRSIRNYGIAIVAIGAAFALYYFVFGGR